MIGVPSVRHECHCINELSPLSMFLPQMVIGSNLRNKLYLLIFIASVGSTAQEIDLDPAPGNELKQWSRTKLEEYVASRFDSFGGNLTNESLSLYSHTHDSEYTFTTMASDIRVGCLTDVLTGKASAALNSPVYRYVVTSRPSYPIYPLGSSFASKYSFHTWDALAFFNDLDAVFLKGPGNSDEDFVNLLHSEILSFVETGKPKNSDWQEYPNITALLGDKVSFVDRFNKQQCEMWERHGILSYAWIN